MSKFGRQVLESRMPLIDYNYDYGTNATSYYGNGIATHDDDLYYNGKPYQSLNLEELSAVQKALYGYQGAGKPGWASTKQAKAWADKLTPVVGQLKSEAAIATYLAQQQAYNAQQREYQSQMAEYQAQMNAFLEKMSETMAAEEPAAEPLKAAAEVQSAARADTSRKQLLRRGLMSTMTRYGGNGQQQKLGA